MQVVQMMPSHCIGRGSSPLELGFEILLQLPIGVNQNWPDHTQIGFQTDAFSWLSDWLLGRKRHPDWR